MVETSVELVSVVIPSRNRRVQLERAIQSVCEQTWPKIEIIIVDDASDDDTPAFLRRLIDSSKVDIKVVRNEVALGGAGARNKGIEVACGTYVAFLDDDDIWLPEKLSSQIELLKQQPSASSVSCSFYIEHSSGKRTVKNIYPVVDSQQILHTNLLGGASMCLTTRQILMSVGCFDAALRSGQDWDLWIKLRDQGQVLVSSTPLVCYRPHEGIRITSNPESAYAGRRRIYFHYKSRMTASTRKHHLCELLYFRKILLSKKKIRRIIDLIKLVGFAGLAKGFRYVYRYTKFMFTCPSITLRKT
jgi:glycosyltransferase involved in cell wall biosynthesis